MVDEWLPTILLALLATTATAQPLPLSKVGQCSRGYVQSGPLDTKRMQTVDEEFVASAMDFMDRKTKEG